MTSSSSRLEQALEVFVRFQREGGSKDELLTRHAELADLLGAMFDESDAEAEGDVFGEFHLVRELGRGGAGVVHEARQHKLGRRVALKILHAPLAANPTALARFHREAQTLARLDHAGVVRVLDVGETGGQAWLALEFVEGCSLADRLDELRAQGGHRGDSLRRLLEGLVTVADALQHAHAAGIVHRDVKPSNVLLREDGRAVLGDFGLARDADDLTLTLAGAAVGTPHYMAPEQIGGQAGCDARTDVFALGTTLYECVTLHRPFDGPNVDVILQRILTRDPPDPRRWQRRLSPDLAAIVLRALEKDPARRYPTARALADDLQAFLELRPVQARPPSRVRRLVRWMRREPLRALLASSAVVAAVLGVVLLAQLPDIRAGARARADREYEASIAAGLMARANQDRAGAMRHLGRALEIAPTSPEAIALWCLSKRRFDGPQAALAELDRRIAAGAAGEEIDWIRLLLLRRSGQDQAADALAQRLGVPRSVLAMWLASVLLAEGAARDSPQAQQALAWISLATRTAANPRLLLHQQWAAIANAFGDAADRHESAEALLHLWPDNPLALHYAAANLQYEDPARSAELQQRAIDHGLEDGYAWRNLAAYLHKAGRHPDWIAPLRRQLAEHPDDRLRGSFVEMLTAAGEQEMAAAELEQWLREAPEQPIALRLAGESAFGRGEQPRALELLRRVVALAPDDVQAHYDLANVSNAGGELTDAVAHARRALELDPEHEPAHRCLLDALRALHDGDGTRLELERWTAVHPDDSEAWSDLATAHLNADPARPLDALQAAEQADHLARGGNAAVLELRARAHDLLGETAAAERLRQLAKAVAAAARR